MNANFKNSSVKQLEKTIMRLYRQKKTDMLKDALLERKYKINKTFEWTPENKEKFLCLNQKLIECWEKLHIEALQVFKTLQSRAGKPDGFLHDFEIELKIRSFIYVADTNGEFDEAIDCIEEVLIDSLYEFDYHVENHQTYYHNESNSYSIYLDKKQNWNTDPKFEGKFNEYFISQAIHDLYDHTHLSFPDILKINRLWGEVRIIHQHFVEL